MIRAGIFVDLFGLEIYIPLRELSYQRWMDAAAHFQPGQRILVKVLEVDRSDRNHVKATASVKQSGENPYEKRCAGIPLAIAMWVRSVWWTPTAYLWRWTAASTACAVTPSAAARPEGRE